MTDVYLAVGHGVRPDGRFDPGARGTDGRYEHYEAAQVAAEAVEGLVRSGVTVVHEAHGSAGPEDPNYKGSVKRVNQLAPKLAVEVHFDWFKAPRGGFGFWISDSGKRIADAVLARWKAADLPTRDRDHSKRGNLYFLNATTVPAMLWECDRVEDYADGTNEIMGEAIAAGICDALGVDYVPMVAVGPAPDRPYYHVVALGIGDVDDILAYRVGKRHALKQVTTEEYRGHAQLADIDCHTIVACGGVAATYARTLEAEGIVERVIVLAGESRYETSDIVAARVDGPDLVDRRNPWPDA